MKMPFPRFYEPAKVGEIYLERNAHVSDVAEEFRERGGVRPAGRDKFRIAAFGIDCQVDFCIPGGSLFVPGAVEDTRRSIEWIYGNLDKITGLHFSMDTHRVFQIFHPGWWIDDQGCHPKPMTIIRHDDVKTGKWKPVSHPRECLEYCRKLEQTGKYILTIWPYHTLLGGLGHALVPALMEAAIFHAVSRMTQTHFETKGTHAMTENYSVLSPEVQELGGQVVGGFNAPFFKLLMEYDRIYIFGQAKSHCVLSTIRDIQTRVRATDAGLAEKVWILEDAMSSVPAPPLDPLPPELDFPRIADAAMDDFRRSGMRIVKTSDPVDF